MADVPTTLVAIVQCEIAHERCTGIHCATAMADRKDLFGDYGPEVRYVVPFPCGGCPGRRVGRLLDQIKRAARKRDIPLDQVAVHLSSCMVLDNHHNPPCPHLEDIRLALARRGFTRVVLGTYLSKAAEKRRAEGVYRPRPTS